MLLDSSIAKTISIKYNTLCHCKNNAARLYQIATINPYAEVQTLRVN